MNETQIVSATMQKVVMDVVANFRVKKGEEEKRDVHSYLLLHYGRNLLSRGFQNDAVKLLAASCCSLNSSAVLMLQMIANEAPNKELEYAINKFMAQKIGYKLDNNELARLLLKYEEMKMNFAELLPRVKCNLYAESPQPIGMTAYGELPTTFDELLKTGTELLKAARQMEWGDYKAWGGGVSTSQVFEAAAKLLLASVHREHTEGLALVKRYLKTHKNVELEMLLKDLETPESVPVIKEKSQQEVKKHFDLNRFLDAQLQDYETALMEMQDGAKESHWIWYIFPQPKGLGHSYNSEYYGLDGMEEARAYLAHPVLDARLREISQTLLLHSRKSIYSIMGSSIDALKLKTCMQLFDSISPNDVFEEVLDTFFKNEI